MVPDDFFSSLEEKEYSQSTTPDIALDWLLNIKKFCMAEQSGESCKNGVYEATYGIEDYASYATPVTDLGSNYKEPQIGGSDSSTSTGAAGEVMQTSPRNPHRYTLLESESHSEDAPSELTGEYLGAFFHHKGSWYTSFDDMDNIGSGSISNKEITTNTKKAEIGSGESLIKKQIYVLDKFFQKGDNANIEDCPCSEDWLVVDFSGTLVSGSICSQGFFVTPCWCEGGFYDGESTREHIETDVGTARTDGVWTSSVNFSVKAHSEQFCEEYVSGTNKCSPETSTSGMLSVTYRGVTKSTSISLVVATYSTNCSEEDVGKTITVYATPLGDGSYFEIV